MRFGSFDDSAREYVIETPRTPYPWINYLGSERFFTLVSNTCGGYSFYRDARLRRITRYRYNNVPLDGTGKYLYIRDGADFWNPGWMPVRAELDRYECRHGMGYTIVTGERNGLRAREMRLVPLGDDCELIRLELENLSTEPKEVSVFTYVEWCLWNALDDFTNFQRNFSNGEVEVEGSAVYHKTEYRERRNHFAFFSVNAPLAGFDTDRETFTGTWEGLEAPQVVKEGRSRNSVAHGWAPIASLHVKASLSPGAKRSFVFVLGYVENPDGEKWAAPGVVNKTREKVMTARYPDSAAVDRAMADLKAKWDELLSNYRVESGDATLDRMVNVWNQYQCMVTFNMSRSASYFESGIGRGMGFRDSNQDTLGFVHMVPSRVRERLIDLAATQLRDGGAYHQYQPLTKRGNVEAGTNFNDDPLWLILSVATYVRETGDAAILDEVVPFENDPARAAPMLEHLKRAFDHVVNNRGPHGLPLIGRADWNDCLNLNCFSREPGDSFQTCTNKDGRTAESVLIAGMFCVIGPEYAELCRRKDLSVEAARAGREIESMRGIVMKHGWDGEWFLRAYDDAGREVGSRECDEGRIYIEPQGWCVMAGLGVDDGRAVKALDSTRDHLEFEYGVCLLDPPYSGYRIELGEISTYPPGYKENAAVFCHNNPWIVLAEVKIGRGDRAWEIYRKTAPAWQEDIGEIRRLEPYVYAQMVAGKAAARPGEAKNSWLTGCAAWTFVAISQGILGVKPDHDGLRIDPCIPKAWRGYKVTRKYRGATYDISVENPNSVSKGVARLELDGKPLDGNLVPAQPAGGRHRVKVVLG